jgi:hypothetical protein
MQCPKQNFLLHMQCKYTCNIEADTAAHNVFWLANSNTEVPLYNLRHIVTAKINTEVYSCQANWCG